MAKVTVYRAKRYEGETDSYRVMTRMFTRAAIEASNSLELIEGTEIEIDASQLMPGEGWTVENFKPENSN